MSENEQWSDELSWRADGHVSDLVVSMMADHQDDCVAEPARLHVDECELCLGRMAEMAAFSLSLSVELNAFHLPSVMAARAGVAPANAFPRRLFALALALACVGALPDLWALQNAGPHLMDLGHDLLAFLRGARVVVALVGERAGDLVLVASMLSVALCVVGGWLISKLAPPDLLEENVG